MEWWERLGYDSEDEAFADGASPPLTDTRTDLEKESDFIKDRANSRSTSPSNTSMSLADETKLIEGYIAIIETTMQVVDKKQKLLFLVTQQNTLLYKVQVVGM